MALIYIVLVVHAVQCIDFKVKIDSFDVVLLGNKEGNSVMNLRSLVDSSDETARVKPQKKKKVVRDPECQYLFPQKEQVDLILSDMMNELTQVFVGANNWLTEKISRRMADLQNAKELRHKLDRRFKVAHRKRKKFFEDVYFNMTDDYKQVYNVTIKRDTRIGYNVCQDQEKVKQRWDELVQRSTRTLLRAVRACVRGYLREQRVPPRSRLELKLRRYLASELQRVRLDLLSNICAKFQLCYDEVLKKFRWKTNLGNDDFKNSHEA